MSIRQAQDKSSKTWLYLEFLLIFLLFFMPLVDTDFGWHLRYGQYFLEHHEFLKNNTLTYFLPGYYWPNSYMFYDVLVTLIYKARGLLGISVIYGLLGVLSYWLFHKVINRPNISLILFLTIFGLSFYVFNLGFRAQFFTFIFLEFELYTILHKPRWIYAFPALFVLWANLHGAFVLGLVVFGIYSVSRVGKGNWREVGKLGSVLGLSFIVALLNPYGVGVYQESLHHANYPLDKLIAEWVPPAALLQVIVTGVSVGTCYLVLKHDNKRDRKFLLVTCILLFAYLAIGARRNVPLWGVFAAASFTEVYQPRWFKFLEDLQLDLLRKVALAGGVLLLLTTWVPRTAQIDTNWENYCTGVGYRLDYPCHAVEYLRTHPQAGRNVYTAYEWGGFLEWQLPAYKPLTDGRMVTWATPEGKNPYTIYLELIQAQPGWNERMLGYGTDWMLIGAGTFLDIELQKDPSGWKEEYRDSVSVVYIKT